MILTRTAIRSSPMPPGESLDGLRGERGDAGDPPVDHQSRPRRAKLLPHYGGDCPAVVAYRVGWPDERLIRGTLGDIRDQVKAAGITRTALILVGPALAGAGSDSRLYAAGHHHVFRPR